MDTISYINIDNKKYYIVDELVEGKETYVYLSNAEDVKDVLIRKIKVKEDGSKVLVKMKNENELRKAFVIFSQKHKPEFE